jgi:uncharacterized protein YjiS (DUF1127 family)
MLIEQRISQIPLPITGISGLLIRLGLQLAEWQNRTSKRKALSRLDAHLLKDIGMCPWATHSEVQKPFWRE